MAFINPRRLHIIPFGGLEEIGKNMTAIRYGNDMILIDAGFQFPDETMYGIDYIIPDFSYILENPKQLKALILTHGHEDHIGAIPYLMKKLNVPIYGTKLTLGLVEAKMKDARLNKQLNLNVVKPRDKIKIGPFQIEFIRVCHSIPDGVAVCVKTPTATILHSGDFKIDYTPIDSEQADLQRFGELGDEGVDLLMSDSTNADTPGHVKSERSVGESFERIFRKATRRIVVTTFASNIHRVQQAINTAHGMGRKVCLMGRSMLLVARKAMDLGYLHVPQGILVSPEDVQRVAPEKIVVITTGSQGEPLSGLARLSRGENQYLQMSAGDLVVISAIPIPGNEKSVTRIINALLKRGFDVVYEKREGIHVSGHACQEELKLLLTLIRPRFFMPIHGEYMHLNAHSQIAQSTGVPKNRIVLAENGDLIELGKNHMKILKKVASAGMVIDGKGQEHVTTAVLEQRRDLARKGALVVSAAIVKHGNDLDVSLALISHGFLFEDEANALLDKARDLAIDAVERAIKNKQKPDVIRHRVEEILMDYFHKETGRRPVLLTHIANI